MAPWSLISFNARGPYRQVSRNGHKFWRVPFVSIIEGVLPGSKGPLFYPRDHISANVGSWIGMPATLNHPTDRNGDPVDVTDPANEAILNEIGLGLVMDDHYDEATLSRRGFAELHAQNVLERAPDVHKALVNGDPIEISTGLYTKDVDTPGKAWMTDRNGRRYNKIATNYVPNHLAILVGQRGACSVADGCGIRLNSSGEPEVTYSEESTVGDGFFSGFWNWMTRNIGVNQPRSQVTGKLKPYGAGVGAGPVHEAAQDGYFGGLCDACGGKLDNGKCPACEAALAEKEMSATMSGNSSIDDLANNYIKEENGKFCVYSESGKRLGEYGSRGEAEKRLEQIEYFKSKSNASPGSNDPEEDDSMKTRAENVAFLVANCDCWKGKGEVLNAGVKEGKPIWSDADVARLVANYERAKASEAVANAVREKLKKPDLALNAIPEELSKMRPGDEEEVPAEEEEEEYIAVKKPTGNATKKKKEGEAVTTLNDGKRLTMAEFERLAPVEFLERDRLAKDLIKNKKGEIVANLTRFIADVEERRAAQKELLALNYEKLVEMQDVARRFGGTTNRRIELDSDDALPIYPPGPTGGDDDYVTNDAGDDPPLDLPTTNAEFWSGKKQRSGSAA